VTLPDNASTVLAFVAMGHLRIVKVKID